MRLPKKYMLSNDGKSSVQFESLSEESQWHVVQGCRSGVL